jgi:glycosyltransferase involved in cell wall biosynthesis
VLQSLYYGAGAFVFPSLAEGFGLPVMEALAVGLPVIASDLPALVEIAGGHATFVTPASVEALACALEQTDSAGEQPGAIVARRDHARTFTWARCASETHRLYEQLRK